jgi:hypothetical protein
MNDLHRAIQKNDTDAVRDMLADKSPEMTSQIAAGDGTALQMAAAMGMAPIVEMLLRDGRANPAADDSAALREAVKHNQLNTVDLLLRDNRAVPSARDDEAIVNAGGVVRSVEMVQLLLQSPKINPGARNNLLLNTAVLRGDLDIVRLLAAHPRVNVSAENNWALTLAVNNHNPDMVDALLSSPGFVMTDQSRAFLLAFSSGTNLACVGRFLLRGKGLTATMFDAALKHAAHSPGLELLNLLLFCSPHFHPSEDQLRSLAREAVALDNPDMLAVVATFLREGFETGTLVPAASRDAKKVVAYLLSRPHMEVDNEQVVVRAVDIATRNGHMDTLFVLMSDPRITCTCLVHAVRALSLDNVRSVLGWPATDPGCSNNLALIIAVRLRQPLIVAELLQDQKGMVSTAARENEAIRTAAANLDLPMIQLLMRRPETDPSAQSNFALRCAVHAGRHDMAEALLADVRVDPSVSGNELVGTAIANADLRMVQILTKNGRADPFVNGFEFLRAVGETGTADHAAVIDFLLRLYMIRHDNVMDLTVFDTVPDLSPDIAAVWQPYMQWRRLREGWCIAVHKGTEHRSLSLHSGSGSSSSPFPSSTSPPRTKPRLGLGLDLD